MLGRVEILMILEKTRNGRLTNPMERAHAIWMGERALKLIDKLEEHLDWIGWGDKWERECSEELRKELVTFNAAFSDPRLGSGRT